MKLLYSEQDKRDAIPEVTVPVSVTRATCHLILDISLTFESFKCLKTQRILARRSTTPTSAKGNSVHHDIVKRYHSADPTCL